MGVVYILNKQSSKNETIMYMIRRLVLILLEHNITLEMAHIPGIHNNLCDLLSRKQVPAATLKQHGMQVIPTPIPEDTLPQKLNM